MNKLDLDYQNLLKGILENGVEKDTRNGKVLSIFGRQIRHKMSEGFPLLTTKRMYWKGIVTELLWFLRGDTNIKWLVENDCHIWDGDVYKNYVNKLSFNENDCFVDEDINKPNKTFIPYNQEQFINEIKTDDEFAKKWGNLGPVYGAQWRSWTKDKDAGVVEDGVFVEYEQIDQISELIKQLKDNPDSRRLLVSAWAVHDLPKMTLPPCHYGFQVYTRELSYDEKVHEARKRFGFELEDGTRTFDINTKESIEFLNSTQRAISLMYNARSQDVPLGTPFNIASYALLLEIIAKMVNMVPDELITNMGDCHIYKNQIDGIIEQLTREPYPLPKLVISDDVNFTGTIDEFLNSCSISDFKIQGYQSHPTIKIPLSN
jgi:thymidylate synthase